jgi:beta-galactosidase
MNRKFSLLLISFLSVVGFLSAVAQREKTSFDENWKFAYGHPYDAVKDFGFATGYFSYYAKAGYGDGAAAAKFDDRGWRVLNLPHDWVVEQPFDHSGSHSHGYKAIGRNFPEASVGWYRKEFVIPESDLGRRITITFEGIHRDSKVWINGHYMGNEPSGYTTFTYDITECLNYGGRNVVAVRCDVTTEEGWFYEGAGIYRHVWLTKTNPLHVDQNGTFVYYTIKGSQATAKIETTVRNDGYTSSSFKIKQELKNADGKVIAEAISSDVPVESVGTATLPQSLEISDAHLWSVDDPYLHTLVTTIIKDGKVTDSYETVTGIRTVRFDANEGFFLNGNHLKLKGTNNHQDHAGVGTAMPDELNNFRVKQLKDMGSNAIRCSHNPASPALLDACDRLGILIIDENRLMGTAPFVKDELNKMILRDRNHPSVIIWSLGNEEWGIEGNVFGERIIQNMQEYAKKLDPSRMMNCASSGGWGKGVSKYIEVMGFNYLEQGNIDDYHRDFPNTPCIGTEEGSTHATRGIYFDNPERQHLVAYDRMTSNTWFKPIEYCWNYYDSRPFLSGMFIWTGFDYRGEPTPYGWPSISSYFGMYDMCGFPKDNVWYLKSWWGKEPVLHILPHWNWKGKEGQPIKVVVYSNCDQVELLVNGSSQGKKTMLKDSHLEWEVPYKAGSLKAIGYKDGKKQLIETIETTGDAVALKVVSHKASLSADGKDIAILTVTAVDKKGREVPDAENKITFETEGPGRIIGVGNGDPTCLEADKVIDTYTFMKPSNMKMLAVDSTDNRQEVAVGFDDSGWQKAFSQKIKDTRAIIYRSSFQLPDDFAKGQLMLFLRTIGQKQYVYLNGVQIGGEMNQKTDQYTIQPDISLLKPGKNELTFVTTPYFLEQVWSEPNTDPGNIRLIMPAPQWERSLFSGKAQVIVESTKESGDCKLTAKSSGLTPATITIPVQKINE